MRPTLLALFLLASCDKDTPPATADGGSCTCPAPTAKSTSYDNSVSKLVGTDVQGALDELAARPIAEAPVGGRIQTISVDQAADGTAGFATVSASCTDEARDIVLSGSCVEAVASTQAEFKGSVIANSSSMANFTCEWLQPAGDTNVYHVRVVCLTGAK